jgi:acetolactate synthase small subunit
MVLLVDENTRLDQLIKQIEKLYDVISVTKRSDIDCAVFQRMDESVTAAPSGIYRRTEID